MINHATSPKLYRSYYPHRSRDSLSPVCGIFCLISGFVQILRILRHSEHGILVVVCLGWHELGSKYWFLSVFFLYRSISILPFFISHEVSKNWIDFFRVKWHFSFKGSFSKLVCSIVSLMAGWIWLIFWNKFLSSLVEPLKIKKRSSRNFFKKD